MEENEGLELETESGASGESPSQESSEGTDGEGQQAAPKTQPETTPFHEHPRFKELVEQKNSAVAGQKALEQRYAQLEAQIKQLSQPQAPRAPDERAALLEDLKKVDPRLAKVIEELSTAPKELQELRDWRQQAQQQQTVERAVSQVNALHEQNKVSPDLKQMINNEIDRRALQGSLTSLDQIPAVYKEVHDFYNKFVEGVKRSERESYVKSKTVDSKIPASQPKGEPAKTPPKKPTFSKDPETAKAQIVSRYLKMRAAEKDSSPV